MNELVLLSHFDTYQSGNRNIIVKAWDLIKFATKLNILYDSSGCLTRDDFNITGMMGCQHAFNTYQIGKGSKLTTWSIEISNQYMLKELSKFLPKFNLVSLSQDLVSHDSNSLDSIFYKIVSNYEPSFISEEYYNKVISEVSSRLYNINRRMYEFLKFKMNNLELTNATIGRKMSINSTTCNKYINRIGTIMIEVIKET